MSEYVNIKLSVAKDGEVSAFVQYETNLYWYRSTPDKDDSSKWSWWCIQPDWFSWETTNKTKNSLKINVAKLRGEKNPIVSW